MCLSRYTSTPRDGITRYIQTFNHRKRHSLIDYQPPDVVYYKVINDPEYERRKIV